MTMPINSNYVSPFVAQNKNSSTTSSLALQKDKADKLEDLQTKQQTLQNQMLLLKSSSNDASASEEAQKSLEQELEKISAEIQTAKSETAGDKTDASVSISKLNFDTYEKGTEDVSAGVYRIEKDSTGEERVIFDSPSTPEKNKSASTHETLKKKEQLPKAKPESDTPSVNSKQSSSENESDATVNTDKVEQEIKQLNEEKSQIEQALRNVQDDEEKKDLEYQLTQIEAELRMKDNDTYKKQHATYS